MPTLYEYDFSFAHGPDAWKTWMAPSVQRETDATIEAYTRLNAPGDLDPNHIDGIGPIWLVSHLSLSDYGAPGKLNLNNSQIDVTIKTKDFESNGTQLAFWVIRYLPEQDVVANYYVGLQSTNWAYTGGNFIDEIGGEWSTITVEIDNDMSGWTYAGNYVSDQGDWGQRYMPYDLDETLSNMDATLHLVVIGDSPDKAPTGFIDIANISIKTGTEAVPINTTKYALVAQTDEDVPFSGQLSLPDGMDPNTARFAVVTGSAQNGQVSVDADTGTFTFTPDTDFWGPDRASTKATFQYTVSDGTTTSAPKTVLVKVAPINDAPILYSGNEAVTIEADTAFSYRLRLGDDVDRSERLSFQLVEGSVQNGHVELDSASGAYTFTPDTGFSGIASFDYTFTDGQIETTAKTIELTVLDPTQTLTRPSFGQVVQDHLIPGDIDSFVYWTMLLAEQGDVNAAYHYGTWLVAGRYVNQNTSDAARMLSIAHGTVQDATLQLAKLYTSGDGVPRDYEMARTLLTSLGDDATARYRLGTLDDLGFGGPIDHTAAVNNFIEAAKAGNPDAMYTLGRRYLDASGSEYQPDDAYFWLGVGLRLGGGPAIAQFDDLLRYNMDQVRPDLSAERVAELDAAIASWAPGDDTPVNNAPTLSVDAEAYDGTAGQDIEGTLIAGLDNDRDDLSFVVDSGTIIGGILVLDEATGQFTFTPNPGFYGEASFQYRITDHQDSSPLKTVTLAIGYSTDAVDDFATTTETGELVANAANGLLANDLFSTATIAQVQGIAPIFETSIDTTYGTFVLHADGAYHYVANAGYLTEGQSVSDVITYTLQDDEGETDQASLTIDMVGTGGVEMTSSGVILGSAFDDHLVGGQERDTLVGRDGDDILDGGSGAANELYGQGGDDTYFTRAIGDTIIEQPNEGVDTVITSLNTAALMANLENLHFGGTGTFTGFGNDQANTILGGDDTDTLWGLGGDDTLMGGIGDDLLHGGTGANTLNGGEGSDTVSYQTAASGMFVQLNGNGLVQKDDGSTDTLINIENLTGSDHDDVLIGSQGANVLVGLKGRDVLLGLGGNDRLIAHADGAKTMQGGQGDDTYVVYGRLDSIVEFDDEGHDTVETYSSIYRLGNHVENLVSLHEGAFVGLGNTLNNTIIGTEAADFLAGYEGNDVLSGGTGAANTLLGGVGDDVYIVSAIGDSIIENQGEGQDVVQTTLGVYRLGNNVENLTNLYAQEFLGLGNQLDNILTGNGGADYLIGYDGHDVLIGGAGPANTLIGGAGNDLYVVSAIGDSVVENANEGQDTIETVLSTYTLRDNFENLVFTGDGDFTGVGNAADNRLTGGTGNDILSGMDGADVFVFGQSFGDDKILDFDIDVTGDSIDITSASDIDGFTDLISNHLSLTPTGNVTITSIEGSIELVGISANALNDGHFSFFA